MTEIKITGKGGQGVVFAGEILAYAAVLEGKEASAISSYGSQARGGEVSSEVVITEGEILCPFVVEPKFILALSQEGYKSNSELIKEGTKVLYDSSVIKDIKWERNHFPIPASEIASKEVKNPLTANMVLLGAFSHLTKIISLESLKSALKEKMKEKAEENIKALQEGFHSLRDR